MDRSAEIERLATEAVKRIAAVVTMGAVDHMRAGVEAGIKWERERAAKIAEDAWNYHRDMVLAKDHGFGIASAIRRG